MKYKILQPEIEMKLVNTDRKKIITDLKDDKELEELKKMMEGNDLKFIF